MSNKWKVLDMKPDQQSYGNPNLNNGQYDGELASWVCPKCYTINQTDRCVTCGFVRKINRNLWDFLQNQLSTRRGLVIVLGVLVLILLISSGGSISCLFGHDYQPETCTAPKSCSKCGKTIGDPLDHSFQDATCENPEICRDCGEERGAALGHDYTKGTCAKASECTRCGEKSKTTIPHTWLEATYTTPKKCSVCGTTTGNVKGYYAMLPAKWKEGSVSVGGTYTTPMVFDKTVKNCVKFTMHFQITNYKNVDPFGQFAVYAKIDSTWKRIGKYEADDKSMVVKTFEFKEPISFKQLAFVGPKRYGGSYTFDAWIEDWYLQE